MEADTFPRHRTMMIADDDSDFEDEDISDKASLLNLNQTKSVDEDEEAVVLERHIGILGCIFFTVGTTIGSGIFVSPKGVLENAGSTGMALMVWIICGVLCTIGGLCYAELGATFSKSGGGDYTYILQHFGPLPAFLRVWTSIIAVRTAAPVVVAITAATYLLKLCFPACQDPPSAAVRLIAAFILCSVCALNCRSSDWSSRAQGFFTVTKIIGLMLIAVSGIVLLFQSNEHNLKLTFSISDPTKLPLAFYSGLFAYSGFQYLPQISEEIVRPTRTIPIGIATSMIIITSVYLLANVAYFIVLSPEEILTSDAVAIDYGNYILGSFWWTMSIAVALSCIGACNGGIFTTPRMFFVASREGHLPQLFTMLHMKWRTPLPAIGLMLPVMLFMLISQDIYSLINYFSFMRWTFLAMTVAVIPYSRWRDPELERPFKVPIILPFVFIFACMFVVSVSLYSAPLDCGIGLALTLSGIPVYYVGVWWKNKPKWMILLLKCATHTGQKILYVVPQGKVS